MANFFKNRAVAIALTGVVIAGCLGYGYLNRTVPIVNPSYGEWVYDGADILSEETERLVEEYNARWDSDYNSVIAIATVDRTTGWEIYDYASTLGNNWGLGANDMLLLIDEGGGEYWFVTSYNMEDLVGYDTLYEVTNDNFALAFRNGSYDTAVEKLYDAMDDCYEQAYGTGTSSSSYSYGPYYDATEYAEGSEGYSSDFWIGAGFMVLVAFWIVSAIDKARYRSWYRRYNGTFGAPAFMPLVFWRRPGGSWFQRMNAKLSRQYYTAPRSGAAYTPPAGGYGYRPNTTYRTNTSHQSSPGYRSSGASRPGNFNSGSGGFGGSAASRSSSSRSSSSYTRSSGSYTRSSSSSSRGGSFNSGSGGFGGSRSGGSSSGGSRGGGFGGSRGGGFGGKR